MSTIKKCLYYNSFEELINNAEIPQKLKNCDAKKLCKSAIEVYRSAQSYVRGGDEELAFIMFMRYINIIGSLQKRVDYRSKEAELKPLFGGNENLLNALNTAEELRDSLLERFKERDNLQKPSSMDIDTTPVINNQNGNNNKPNSPLPKSHLTKANDSLAPKHAFISPKQLFSIIQAGKNNVLIIDCRLEKDFKESKLKYIHCVNVPEDIIKRGMSAGTIQNKLSTESKELWAYRGVKEDIILMDWDCEDYILNLPIITLKDILLQWDPDVEYKNPILILNGGYGEFMNYYPTLTTKAFDRPAIDTMEIVNLQDIEYSTVNEVPMRDERIFQPINNTPFIDRSSKAAAEKLYNTEQLQHEKEELLDQILLNEQTILDKITELKDENVQKYDGDEAKFNEARLNINNERMELEDKQEELMRMKLENDRIRKQLDEEIARNAQYRMNVDSTINEEIEKRIAEKERREKELREKRKKEAAEVSEKRRRESEMMAERERLTKPRVPTFDRSAKPQLNYVDEQTIVRNFSGQGRAIGPGLTGLVNLYNNCYMNNIVQCLSNTNDLVQYFLSNRYELHINRSNETHGRIAEELSALFKEIWSKEYAYISSIDFRNTVGQYHSMFAGPDHQDSHEFLRILIDWMHLDLETHNSEIPRVKGTAADKAWLAFLKNKESVILDLFYGQFKSTLKCVECACESATYDSFSDLSLQVPSITRDLSSTDIEKCLDNFFYGEYIDDWECPKCQVKRRAVKKLDISKLPKILVIHFKRFQVDLSDSGRLVKSSKKQINITFPLVGLNMSKHIAPSAKASNKSKQMYNLYGVSNHYGTLSAGHYTAFCKSRVLHKWFKFDDKKVSPLDPSNVVTSAAYILFYTNETPLYSS